jgi:uncharacterized membrane protein YhfC
MQVTGLESSRMKNMTFERLATMLLFLAIGVGAWFFSRAE